jgi:hypothetical protein
LRSVQGDFNHRPKNLGSALADRQFQIVDHDSWFSCTRGGR